MFVGPGTKLQEFYLQAYLVHLAFFQNGFHFPCHWNDSQPHKLCIGSCRRAFERRREIRWICHGGTYLRALRARLDQRRSLLWNLQSVGSLYQPGLRIQMLRRAVWNRHDHTRSHGTKRDRNRASQRRHDIRLRHGRSYPANSLRVVSLKSSHWQPVVSSNSTNSRS